MQDMGKKPPGLIRRGNNLYVRKRVPDDIRDVIGVRERWKSLGSGDYNAVREDFWAICAEIEEEFAQARRSKQRRSPLLYHWNRLGGMPLNGSIKKLLKDTSNCTAPFAKSKATIWKNWTSMKRCFPPAPMNWCFRIFRQPLMQFCWQTGFPRRTPIL